MAYDPYASLNPALPSNFFVAPKGQNASKIRAFNQGVQRNNEVRNGPTSMMRSAAAVGGGWNKDYNSVLKTIQDAWAPYGNQYARSEQDVDRQMNSARSSGAARPAEMSFYSPGRAQPKTSSGSSSTPYSAWRPQSSSSSGGVMPSGSQSASKQELVAQRLAAGGSINSQGAWNRAVQAANNRRQGIPDPLYPGGRPQQQSPSTQGRSPQNGLQSRTVNFDGSVTRQPNYALRDAFAQNINSAMMPYYQNSGTYLGEGAPPPSWGQAPQFNFPQLYGQAANMVANGYQNPLAGLFG